MKNIIKNKKAELTTTEIVKIILAVIGISILIYLAVGLYGIFINKGNDVEQAKASLDNLYSGINKIESGEKISVEILIESPNNWWVIAWPYQSEKEKPTQCKKDYCICICPDDSLERCNKEEICKDVSKPIYTIDETVTFKETPLIIDGVINLNISLEEEQFVVRKIE